MVSGNTNGRRLKGKHTLQKSGKANSRAPNESGTQSLQSLRLDTQWRFAYLLQLVAIKVIKQLSVVISNFHQEQSVLRDELHCGHLSLICLINAH